MDFIKINFDNLRGCTLESNPNFHVMFIAHYKKFKIEEQIFKKKKKNVKSKETLIKTFNK